MSGEPVVREDRAGPFGVAERPVVVRKPGNAGGGEGALVWDGRWQERAKRGLSMRLQTPPKVEKLRKALHAKAKAEPEFRFYVLYDKVCREDIVAHAYALCRANGAAAGVDGETFEAIESRGREACVVCRFVSWDLHVIWPDYSVDGLPGMVEQSGKLPVVMKLPLS